MFLPVPVLQVQVPVSFDKLPGEISYEYGEFQVLLTITVELTTYYISEDQRSVFSLVRVGSSATCLCVCIHNPE